jgi:transcriptional regulator with PAS, ATPase and Fis domain
MHLTEEIFKQLPFAVTACDKNANIIYMNDKSLDTFRKSEADNFIGKSLFDCHNIISTEKIKKLLETGKTNSYTIEKNGQKKLIYQCPWYKDNQIAGLVEISLIIPDKIPHYVRK